MKSIPKKIFIGCDHAGFSLKEQVKRQLEKDFKVYDCSPKFIEGDDYPSVASDLAQFVVNTKSLGILICSSGIGMSISANKVKGARAALCRELGDAVVSRSHNNANILCLGASFCTSSNAKTLTQAFLSTPFSGSTPSGIRHKRRISLIKNIEETC